MSNTVHTQGHAEYNAGNNIRTSPHKMKMSIYTFYRNFQISDVWKQYFNSGISMNITE